MVVPNKVSELLAALLARKPWSIKAPIYSNSNEWISWIEDSIFKYYVYINLRATDDQNSCLLLPYVLWYSSFLLLLSSTKKSVWGSCHWTGWIRCERRGIFIKKNWNVKKLFEKDQYQWKIYSFVKESRKISLYK